MANTRFISESKVPPAAYDDQKEFGQRIELTPWDLRLSLFEHLQKGLLFHKPPDSFSLICTTLVDHLKATLARALAVFYPLAGRLVAVENNDDTASLFIECNGAGALFVHAAVEGGITVADILDPVIIPDDLVYSFFPMNGVLNGEAAFSKLPLLAVQVTELVDGVFVACTMNHCAGDGTCFWHFFNVWSEISRSSGSDLDGVSRYSLPVFGRECFEGVIDLPISIPLSRQTILDHKKHVPQPNLQQRMFRFSKEKIREIKTKANEEMGTTKSDEMISSLQALLAHLWLSVTRNRRLDPDDEVNYMVVTAMRSRIQPPLPEGYLGNSALGVRTKCTARELLDRGLGGTAWKINRTIASQTAAEARKFLEDWAETPKLAHVGTYPVNRLSTGSSPRFDVYGNDFGWGRPIAVRSGPGTKFDGKMTVFPGAEGGSIDFEACLLAETLESLACDAEFTETLN